MLEFPEMLDAAVKGLNSNYLIPSSSALFKVLAKLLSSEQWMEHCQSVLISALKSDDRVVRKNAILYWLPCVYEIDSTFCHLKQQLFPSDPTEDGNFNWLACLALLKHHSCQLGSVEWRIVEEALDHGDEDVRMSAFGCLCYAKKKTESIANDHWRLFSTFVVDNLHSDDPQFRQNLQANVKQFLLRVLENSLSCIKTSKWQSSIPPDRESDLYRNIEQVEALNERLVERLQPGASYQRKIATLDSLQLILKLFSSSSLQIGNLTKNVNISNRKVLIEIARSWHRWNFTSNCTLQKYCVLVMDDLSDVRDKSAEILSQFFRPDAETVRVLRRRALRLCDSAKFQRSECGARIFQLVHFWCQQEQFHHDDLACFNNFESVVGHLLSEIEWRFADLKRDFLQAARYRPMHGMICALKCVFQSRATNASCVRMAFYTPIVEMCIRIRDFMLDVLAGGRKSQIGTDNGKCCSSDSTIPDFIRVFR